MSMHLFFAEVAFSEATSSTAKIDELRLLCAYENGSVTLRRYTGSTSSYSIEGRGWEAIWTAKLHAETSAFQTIPGVYHVRHANLSQ